MIDLDALYRLVVTGKANGEIPGTPLTTKNSYRRVSISPQAIEVLKAQTAKSNEEYVFPSPSGGPISPGSVNNMLKRVLERAGIPKVRFHDLRHTRISILLSHGVSVIDAAKRAGHKQPTTTANIYSHVLAKADQKAADVFSSALKTHIG